MVIFPVVYIELHRHQLRLGWVDRLQICRKLFQLCLGDALHPAEKIQLSIKCLFRSFKPVAFSAGPMNPKGVHE